MQKTQQEIDELKRQWLRDPCWDIELTECFGDHVEELKTFADQQAAFWQEKREMREKAIHAELLQKADALGIPGNTALVLYIQKLEGQVIELTQRLNRMDGDF